MFSDFLLAPDSSFNGKDTIVHSCREETQASVPTLFPSQNSLQSINQSPCPPSSIFLSHTVHSFSVTAAIPRVHSTIFPCLESHNSLLTNTPTSTSAPFQPTLHAHQNMSDKQNGKIEIFTLQNPSKSLCCQRIKSRFPNRVSSVFHEPPSSLRFPLSSPACFSSILLQSDKNISACLQHDFES